VAGKKKAEALGPRTQGGWISLVAEDRRSRPRHTLLLFTTRARLSEPAKNHGKLITVNGLGNWGEKEREAICRKVTTKGYVSGTTTPT